MGLRNKQQFKFGEIKEKIILNNLCINTNRNIGDLIIDI